MPSTTPPTPSRGEARRPLTVRVAGWSARNAKKTIGGWLLLVVLSVLIGGAAGSGAQTSDPGESGRAQKVIREQNVEEPYQESVLIEALDRTSAKFADDAALQKAAQDLVDNLKAAGTAVTDVASPLGAEGAEQVSKDGRSALVGFTVAGPEDSVDAHFESALAAVEKTKAAHPEVRIAEAGDLSLQTAVNDAADSGWPRPRSPHSRSL